MQPDSSHGNGLVPALTSVGVLAALGFACATLQADERTTTADLVVRNAKIYTVDKDHSTAEALAVKDGRIVFVGSSRNAQAWVGHGTRVSNLHGKLVLPGLIDSHIHPLDIADLDVCDLADRELSLAELTRFVSGCLEHYQTPAGALLRVYQWNYAGNQPDNRHATLRAALDAASTTRQIELLGEDGHHGAYNSLALANAKNGAGEVVGLSKATLATDFVGFKALVGVDAQGEPNGAVNEDARAAINRHGMLYLNLDEVEKAPERITEKLARSGITGVLDAYAAPEGQVVYDKLLAANHLTARVELAQFFDPSATRKPDGEVDYDAMLARANVIRTKYAATALIRADVVKIFADGTLEGDPLAVPPTLPNGASLRPFLQPIFALDAHGRATVTGYVDTDSALCKSVRDHPDQYGTPDQVGGFMRTNGYHPAQCTISDGQLQHQRAIILEYAKRMHLAGYSLHIHAIGDRAVRTAIDAIEQARAADGISSTRDALAHVQLADPADVARIGHDHLYVAFTYAWMNTDPEYDITVIPFIQPVHGNDYAALHPSGGYYDANAYPVRSMKEAGAVITAGSDAPVDTRDPRPFVNMAYAVTRHNPGQPPLGPQQRITLPEVIDAYTINGAQMLNLAADAGSLEVGKSADFVVLDHDILALAAKDHADEIAETRVLATWFQGKLIYADGDF
jgi:predicted amidohydrolase YtcJ